ncbi:MAG: EamA family transporter, partial [Fusobacterium periodonticum]|nr:EamA family transporter [Fusobacterium periodonticum]
PVAATICAILFLGVTFDFLDLIGFICIISTIFIVAYFDKKTKKK